jgi:hypothetical protein
MFKPTILLPELRAAQEAIEHIESGNSAAAFQVLQ